MCVSASPNQTQKDNISLLKIKTTESDSVFLSSGFFFFCLFASLASMGGSAGCHICILLWLDVDQHFRLLVLGWICSWQLKTRMEDVCNLTILLLVPTQGGARSLPGSCSLLPSSHHSLSERKHLTSYKKWWRGTNQNHLCGCGSNLLLTSVSHCK